jgi:hypothetical protein
VCGGPLPKPRRACPNTHCRTAYQLQQSTSCHRACQRYIACQLSPSSLMMYRSPTATAYQLPQSSPAAAELASRHRACHRGQKRHQKRRFLAAIVPRCSIVLLPGRGKCNRKRPSCRPRAVLFQVCHGSAASNVPLTSTQRPFS